MKWGWLFPLIVLPAFGRTTTPDRVQLPDSPSQGLTLTPGGAIPDHQPVTTDGRVRWFVATTASPVRLLIVGPISAGWGTLRNIPSEYGTHWDGFAKRKGMRLTGVSTGNLIEAGLGSVWGEDPRYFRSRERGLRLRVEYVLKTTFFGATPGWAMASGERSIRRKRREQFFVEYMAR